MTVAKHPKIRIEPRGLHREEAAAYIGVGLSKFDEMVRDGRMPGPRKVDTRNIWDRYALDDAFENLPMDVPENPLDYLLCAARN